MSYKRFIQDTYQQGELIPLWKGYVHYNFMRNTVRVAPIPFNIIYSLVYSIFDWVRCARVKQHEFLGQQLEIRKRR